MKNVERYLVDTLGRLKRSIVITGTGMNYKGRKSVEYPDFEKRFLREISFPEGSDPNGYYGVRLTYVVDGGNFVIDTALKKAMAFDSNPKYVKNGELKPVVYGVSNKKMIDFLNVYYRAKFGDYLAEKNGGMASWTDYVCPKAQAISREAARALPHVS